MATAWPARNPTGCFSKWRSIPWRYEALSARCRNILHLATDPQKYVNALKYNKYFCGLAPRFWAKTVDVCWAVPRCRLPLHSPDTRNLGPPFDNKYFFEYSLVKSNNDVSVDFTVEVAGPGTKNVNLLKLWHFLDSAWNLLII